ncbi:hypothetical protein M2171_001596 [Bradyrhizobium japonicum USDA 38]|nr:hypothetical protein [Bradyrhizobium japonicum USDA 38]MCS3944977.1 hypothetical protein [Bradyrhizobium japonicum]
MIDGAQLSSGGQRDACPPLLVPTSRKHGGHGAQAARLCPPYGGYARFAVRKNPHAAIAAINSEISTL